MIMKIRIIRRFCLLMALTLGGMVSASAQEFVDSIIVEQKSKTKPKREFNRWGVSLDLITAWIITIPVSALIGACVYGVVVSLV